MCCGSLPYQPAPASSVWAPLPSSFIPTSVARSLVLCRWIWHNNQSEVVAKHLVEVFWSCCCLRCFIIHELILNNYHFIRVMRTFDLNICEIWSQQEVVVDGHQHRPTHEESSSRCWWWWWCWWWGRNGTPPLLIRLIQSAANEFINIIIFMKMCGRES